MQANQIANHKVMKVENLHVNIDRTMPQHISLTLSAVLLSATVISSPSQASILPPTPSEQRDLLSAISLAVTDGVKLPQFAA